MTWKAEPNNEDYSKEYFLSKQSLHYVCMANGF